MNEVVTEVEKSLRSQLGADIRLTTVLSPSLGSIKSGSRTVATCPDEPHGECPRRPAGRGNLVIEN